jgi:transcriptional regulator GlxA family with amidase domain
MQIIATVRQYFGLHFQESIDLGQLPALLGISKDCLDLSFEQVRGISLAQALQEHRLNKLFAVLTDQPRQGLGHAIAACGLWPEPDPRCCGSLRAGFWHRDATVPADVSTRG